MNLNLNLNLSGLIAAMNHLLPSSRFRNILVKVGNLHLKSKPSL